MIFTSFSRIKFYLMVAFFYALAIAILSGWREVGIDRDNYIQMYNGVISNNDWATKLWYAKDLFFLIVALLANYFSEDARLAFLVITYLSIFLKYSAISKMTPNATLGFVILYSIFLAPGLEFAALRGGLALGFVMLALVYRSQNIRFFILAVLVVSAHNALILVIFLAVSKVNKFLYKHKWGYVIITLVVYMAADFLIKLFPHGADYENNRGTVFAFSEPLATLLIAWLIFFRLDRFSNLDINDPTFQHLQFLRQIVYGLISIAFGITSVVVTASTRYLEISWCLLLFTAIVMFRKSFINMLGALLLLFLLSYINILRLTWLTIFNPTLVL